MATGNYGIVRPADVSINDVEIFYTYQPDRTVKDPTVKRLLPAQVLQQKNHPDYTNRVLGGLYDLTLPTAFFNQLGVYTIYIRPKEIRLRITDCGVLASSISKRGLIFNLAETNAEDTARFENNGLIGYRVEYLNTTPSANDQKLRNLFRLITSNFRVEPIADNLNSTSQKSIRYRANDASSLVFCTLTPSSAPFIRPNLVPFIGQPGQEIILTNTFFDPIAIEVELVQYDLNSIAYGLYGDKTKSVKNGILTVYNDKKEIYKQFDEFTIQDQTTLERLYEVRKQRTQIDFTQNLDNIITNG